MKNPFKGLCLALIRFYQRCISPYTPAHCRFYQPAPPYAFQAISRFGVLRGGFLAVKRILRAIPSSPAGTIPSRRSSPFSAGGPAPIRTELRLSPLCLCWLAPSFYFQSPVQRGIYLCAKSTHNKEYKE